nr:MAG TPA: hypothetical protein [Caudoviricetes sp.]
MMVKYLLVSYQNQQYSGLKYNEYKSNTTQTEWNELVGLPMGEFRLVSCI